MDGGFLRRGRAAVDARVVGEHVLLGVLVRALVRGHEASGPVGPHLVVQRFTLPAREVPDAVVHAGLLQRRVRTLLRQPLVQALALVLLTRCGAVVFHRERTLGR